jgi:disulfide bond formation protein DsbB
MSSEALMRRPTLPPTENAGLAIFVIALLTIGGAWIFQSMGYLPCDLCYEQRYAYYIGLPLAALAAVVGRSTPKLAALLFLALAVVFAVNVALAVYHSGVEMKLWQGPTACTGSALGDTGGDLLSAINTVKVVRCDDVGLRVFGLTLANWNVFVSAALSSLALIGGRRALRA